MGPSQTERRVRHHCCHIAERRGAASSARCAQGNATAPRQETVPPAVLTRFVPPRFPYEMATPPSDRREGSRRQPGAEDPRGTSAGNRNRSRKGRDAARAGVLARAAASGLGRLPATRGRTGAGTAAAAEGAGGRGARPGGAADESRRCGGRAACGGAARCLPPRLRTETVGCAYLLSVPKVCLLSRNNAFRKQFFHEGRAAGRNILRGGHASWTR